LNLVAFYDAAHDALDQGGEDCVLVREV